MMQSTASYSNGHQESSKNMIGWLQVKPRNKFILWMMVSLGFDS